MRCQRHDDCFSARHDLLSEVERKAKLCPEGCPCWRHAVLRHIASRGASGTGLMLSERVPEFDQLVTDLKERIRGAGGAE